MNESNKNGWVARNDFDSLFTHNKDYAHYFEEAIHKLLTAYWSPDLPVHFAAQDMTRGST